MKDSMLESALKFHKVEINLSLQRQKHEKVKERLRMEQLPIEEDESQEGHATNYFSKIIGKNQQLKNYDYNQNIFQTISSQKQLDNSSNSIENFYKMLNRSYQDTITTSNESIVINEDSQLIDESNSSMEENFGLLGQKSFQLVTDHSPHK